MNVRIISRLVMRGAEVVFNGLWSKANKALIVSS